MENNLNTSEVSDNPTAFPKKQVLALIILISVLAGSFGGAVGGLYLSNQAWFQKYFLNNQKLNIQSQKIVLEEQSAVIDLVKKTSPAVVSIVISKDINKLQSNPFGNSFFAPFFGQSVPQNQTPNIQPVGAGTGFIVSNDGTIITNKHVVSDTEATYSVVTSEGKNYSAKVLSLDPINDLAIVKIDIQNAPTLDLGDSTNLQIGQQVVAIGNSLGEYQNTVTTGIISGIGRSITAGGAGLSEQLEGVIQTDAAINPGNSGGPLLNLAGQVIGINTAIDQNGQLVGFALPVKDIKQALDSFKTFGKITRPMLGVRYVLINDAIATQQKLSKNYGALITKGKNPNEVAIISGSPADKAGLVENDIILEINNQQINTKHSLASYLKDFKVGDAIELQIYHQGNEKNVRIVLTENK